MADNRIVSVGPAELGERGRIAYAACHAVARSAKAGRRAEDAVDRVVELVRGSSVLPALGDIGTIPALERRDGVDYADKPYMVRRKSDMTEDI